MQVRIGVRLGVRVVGCCLELLYGWILPQFKVLKWRHGGRMESQGVLRDAFRPWAGAPLWCKDHARGKLLKNS